MIDVIAATGVLAGGTLAVLAGVGLLRFPDALTRMHAAAKAATTGVIATTLAAALEVDTFDAAALLVLVTALLFLSAPLGTSLLARAAYRDPDTPRLLGWRDDLAGATPDPTPGRASEGADRGAVGLLAGWLFVVWVALFASVTPGVVLGAAVIAAVVAAMLPGYRPRWPRGILRPLAALRFAAVFVRTVVAANLDVIRALLTRRSLRPAVIRVPLLVSTPTEVTLLMNVITFTPGSVALEFSGGDLYIHVLDLRDEAGFRAEVARLEALIVAAFGTGPERAALRRVR